MVPPAMFLKTVLCAASQKASVTYGFSIDLRIARHTVLLAKIYLGDRTVGD